MNTAKRQAKLEQDWARRQREELQRSLRFMATAEAWPCWPYLPVKRTKAGEVMEIETGVMCEFGITTTKAAAPKVYLANMFTFDPKRDTLLEYPDLAAVVNDGWRVD